MGIVECFKPRPLRQTSREPQARLMGSRSCAVLLAQILRAYRTVPTVYFTFGVSNPSRYPMDSTWRITIDYTAAGVVLTASETFHVAAQGVVYPRWQFTMTSGQVSSLGSASNQSLTVSIDRSFTVHGTYGTYDFTRHDTYNSATGVSSGTGSTGSSGSLPAC